MFAFLYRLSKCIKEKIFSPNSSVSFSFEKKDNELQGRYNEILNIGEIPIFFCDVNINQYKPYQLPRIIQLLYSFKQIQDSFEIKEAF